VPQRNPRDWFQPVLVYSAYNAGGREMNHGPFQWYEEGSVIQTGYFKDGRLAGTQTCFHALGDKVQELNYHNDRPYGWANYSRGKLLMMRKDIVEQKRPGALQSYKNGQYTLEFRRGELIDRVIDPSSGELREIANARKRGCTAP
jgi:antitoxin component YwqK of YwqJK toxin-antitoxin module